MHLIFVCKFFNSPPPPRKKIHENNYSGNKQKCRLRILNLMFHVSSLSEHHDTQFHANFKCTNVYTRCAVLQMFTHFGLLWDYNFTFYATVKNKEHHIGQNKITYFFLQLFRAVNLKDDRVLLMVLLMLALTFVTSRTTRSNLYWTTNKLSEISYPI
jgi:hypothetical protein